MPLTLRLTKGTALTHQELDDNFTYLNGLIDGVPGQYTLPTASSTVKGGVTTGYTTNSQNYQVQSSGTDLYVNVPWVSGIDLSDLSITTVAASSSGSLSYDNSSGVFTFSPADLSNAGGGIALTDLSTTTGAASGNGALSYSSSTGTFTFSPVVFPNNYAMFTADGDSTGALQPSNANDVVYFKAGNNVTITAGTSAGTGNFNGVQLDSLTFDVDLSSVSGSSGTTVAGLGTTNQNQPLTGSDTVIPNSVGSSPLGFVNNTSSNGHYVLTWTIELQLTESALGFRNFETSVHGGPTANFELIRFRDSAYITSGSFVSKTYTYTVVNLASSDKVEIKIKGDSTLVVTSATLSIAVGTHEGLADSSILLLPPN